MQKCRDCSANTSFFDLADGRCPDCHFKRQQQQLAEASSQPDPATAQQLAHILLTTEGAPGLPVTERLGIVSAEFAVGMGLLTDIFNAWRDVFGGRSKSYQNALKDARKAVLDELKQEAHAVGANAVIAVHLDYSEISGGGKSMMFLVATGTAVRLA
jgi:uncharacterized protein YbjQ (UPF0145 family)